MHLLGNNPVFIGTFILIIVGCNNTVIVGAESKEHLLAIAPDTDDEKVCSGCHTKLTEENPNVVPVCMLNEKAYEHLKFCRKCFARAFVACSLSNASSTVPTLAVSSGSTSSTSSSSTTISVSSIAPTSSTSVSEHPMACTVCKQSYSDSEIARVQPLIPLSDLYDALQNQRLDSLREGETRVSSPPIHIENDWVVPDGNLGSVCKSFACKFGVPAVLGMALGGGGAAMHSSLQDPSMPTILFVSAAMGVMVEIGRDIATIASKFCRREHQD